MDEDFLILEYFVANLKKYEYIPVEVIVRSFEKRFSQKEIIARLKKLAKMKLIERNPSTEAYRLRFLGLDCVALHRLVKRDVVKAIGDRIGGGKESILFQAIANDESMVTIKFHRIGRSFRNISRVRAYGESFSSSTWLVKSIVSGSREREALTILNKYGVKGVPKFYGGALHSVVIEYINGVDLYELDTLENPEEILNQIIDTIKDAYWKAGIVHGDLSEYNVIVDLEKNRSYIIDWPQYVTKADPNALAVLKNDIQHILNFFRRKFRVIRDLNETLKYVLESTSIQ